MEKCNTFKYLIRLNEKKQFTKAIVEMSTVTSPLRCDDNLFFFAAADRVLFLVLARLIGCWAQCVFI